MFGDFAKWIQKEKHVCVKLEMVFIEILQLWRDVFEDEYPRRVWCHAWRKRFEEAQASIDNVRPATMFVQNAQL